MIGRSNLKITTQRDDEDSSGNSTNTKGQVAPLNSEVHCSISGSDASASSAMHLHYGPSSTFVFLQQLSKFLAGGLGSR